MPEPAPGITAWRRETSTAFTFSARRLDAAGGRVELEYRLDGIALREEFVLPVSGPIPAERRPAVDAALDLLHWTAGISYWKAGCPAGIGFGQRMPDPWQAEWLTRLYREGLAEFAWHNGLARDRWPVFDGVGQPAAPAAALDPADATLLPLGGGKDSLVALQRLRDAGIEPDTVQVGRAELIGRVAQAAGCRHRVVARRLDPALAELNHHGAFNGHVPITAINAAVLVLLAVVGGYRQVVFANERSADEATLVDDGGDRVNHQFTKSHAFERMLDDWVRRYIAADVRVFSLLRRDRELAVCRDFAGLDAMHEAFSSCNRNFHLDGSRTGRWCGECPKCHFVFLCLAVFLPPRRLVAIFGADLLADEKQTPGFTALLALDGAKPFECVGEAVEARAAVRALAASDHWRDHAVVRVLDGRLQGMAVPAVAELCRPGGDHLIPDELAAAH